MPSQAYHRTVTANTTIGKSTMVCQGDLQVGWFLCDLGSLGMTVQVGAAHGICSLISERIAFPRSCLARIGSLVFGVP
ncbi:MAG: hypothetical protein QOE30_1955 [Mycobacterium sp.]|jgi:hypothetical protein|nr:hypothetical protein [Mycobacterium sp.]